MGDGPHGLPVVGAGEDAEELGELGGGGGVAGVVGNRPVEEAERLVAGAGAGAEDAEDELGVYGEAGVELVEGALQVDVAGADDAGDVVDDAEVFVCLLGGGGRVGGGSRGRRRFWGMFGSGF